MWLGGRQKLVLVKVIADALREKDEQWRKTNDKYEGVSKALCRAQNPLEHADYFTPTIEARVRTARREVWLRVANEFREQTSKDLTIAEIIEGKQDFKTPTDD